MKLKKFNISDELYTEIIADGVEATYESTGNLSGEIPVSNGILCSSLNADMVDNLHVGNLSGEIPISNGTKCDTLNAALLEGKTIQDLINILYPIGSFYVQYPAANSDDDATAFPTTKRPQTMFGGSWDEQWSSESIYFRTSGNNESRSAGYQADAMQRITGVLDMLSADQAFIVGAYGVFTVGGNTGRRPTGGENATRYRYAYFDSANSTSPSTAKTSDIETRVKNRLMKVWKRTGL